MKVNRPGSPFGGSSEPLEPLDPRDLQGAARRERFAGIMSELEGLAAGGQVAGAASSAGGAAGATRAGLEQIAREANLNNPDTAFGAVRGSAALMIGSRLREDFRDSEQGQQLISDLSDFVASDPLLQKRLLSILNKLKAV